MSSASNGFQIRNQQQKRLKNRYKKLSVVIGMLSIYYFYARIIIIYTLEN